MVSTRRRVGPTSVPHRQPAPAPTKFFKVVLPSTIERKMLRIPPKFVKNFGSELSHIATLTTPAGLKRQIWLKQVDQEIWFHGGWCEFAEYHSIRAGHFLVFDYLGNSGFQVLIFDMTACEINYRRDYVDVSEVDDGMNNKGVAFLSSQGNNNEENEIGLSSDSSTYKLKKNGGSVVGSEEGVIGLDESQESDKSFHMKLGRDETIGSSGRTQSRKPAQDRIEPFKVHREGNKAIVSQKFYGQTVGMRNKIHEAKMLKLKNPSFMIIIKPSCIRCVYVPSRFMRRYLTEDVENYSIQDPTGRTWLVNADRKDDYIRLRNEWPEIVRANNLKTRDICTFELIGTEENLGFKLHIFKSAQAKSCM